MLERANVLFIFLYLNGLESLSKEKRAWFLQVELTCNFQLSFIEFVGSIFLYVLSC